MFDSGTQITGRNIIFMLDWDIFSAEKSKLETSKWMSPSIELYHSRDHLLDQDLRRKSQEDDISISFWDASPIVA